MENRWGNSGETVSDFIFLGSKITADGDCSHEIKRCLLLGRKVVTNLDSILKSRDITLPTKVHLAKAIREGNGTPLQYCCLENPMDREVCQATVHGVTIVGHNHHHHTAYKFNKHSNNIEPWDTPFSIWNQSIFPCLVLTVASWPAYRFLRRKVM